MSRLALFGFVPRVGFASRWNVASHVSGCAWKPYENRQGSPPVTRFMLGETRAQARKADWPPGEARPAGGPAAREANQGAKSLHPMAIRSFLLILHFLVSWPAPAGAFFG